VSSNIRAVVCAGANGSGDAVNIMEYVTIASTGNTTDFGDTTVAKTDLAGDGCGTLGLIGGGYASSNYLNVMESITIASTGNGSDFGDLTIARRELGAFSSAHGGLS
jgi:hypothetical protein